MAAIEVRHLTGKQVRAEVAAWQAGEVEHVSDQAAQTVASWHQGPDWSGQFMRLLASTGRCDELLPTEVRRRMEQYSHDDSDREELEALLDYTDLFVPVIFGCWSAFDHRFMSGGTPLEETCLSCGGTWRQVRRPDDPSMADYKAADGSDPVYCVGAEEALYHGGESVCQADGGSSCQRFEDRGRCRHMAYLAMPALASQGLAARKACNCLTCRP